MRQTLYKRLGQLEEASARNRQSSDAEANSRIAMEKVMAFLKCQGIERQGGESLMQALARALEISCSELRRSFAAGIDPMHKYLVDRGILAEIKTRQAAGTWPRG